MSEYDKQAQAFLNRYKLSVSIKWAENQTDPDWAKNAPHGDKYRVTIRRSAGSTDYGPQSLSFDYWGSAHDAQNGVEPSAYDVLSCVASDVDYADMNINDLMAEFGMDSDSRREYAQARRIIAFGTRLANFLTTTERESLAEIQ